MKKALSLVLAGLMAMSGTAALADAGTTSSAKDAAPLELVSEPDEYPLKDAQPISWFVASGFGLNEAYGKWEDSPFHSGLNEMTGVDIDWQFPTAGTDATQAFNLMMASETLPDIISYENMIKDVSRYIEEGVVRDLSDTMATNSPAYYAFLQSNPDYDKAMKTDDGKYYGYGFFREAGGWNDTYLGPVVRKDWLDECGLEVPTTVSEFENVIKTFKEKYNAPLSFAWSRFKTTGISGAFGAYGATTMQFYIDKDKKVQLAQAQPEWATYMGKLNEWWQAGLLDQDVFSLDDTAEKTKALNGNVGISITSMGQISNWRTEAEAAGNGADWIGIPYPTGDDGTLSMVFGGSGIGSNVGVLSTSCSDEKVETAMRLLDYAYTKEGNLYWNFGKEGVSWEYDADGNPAYTELVTGDKDGLNNAISKYGGSTWSGNCIQATRLLYMKNTQASIDANDTWYYNNLDVTSSWALPRTLTFTSDESDELDELSNAISTYVSEQGVKFINGEASIDDFQSYLDTLNGMNLSRVLEIYQAAYDRYLAR